MRMDLPDREIDKNALSVEIQSKMVIPSLRILKEKYEGTVDSVDHISCFWTTLNLYGVTDAVKCRIFPTTLKRMLRMWFNSLRSSSVISFKYLNQIFIRHFMANKRETRTLANLWFMMQRPTKSLWNYIKRFTIALADMKDQNKGFTI